MVPGMIDKNYFRRQARTLRKMVKVAQDSMVAERLNDMAEDFDARAREGVDQFGHGRGPRRGSRGDEEYG